VNYVVVLVLTVLHIYSSSVVYGLFIFEAVVLFWVMRPAFSRPVSEILKDDYARLRDLLASITGGPPLQTVVQMIIFTLAIFSLVLYGEWAWLSIGHIFDKNDEVLSWNRWAVDWSHGRFPTQTWRYPQLLPTIFSLTYVFIGDSTVQFFARAITPLFSIAILLALFDLGLRTKQIGYFLAICITRFLMPFAVDDVTAGHADVPVAFMAFVPIYLLLLIRNSSETQSRHRDLILGAVVCAGSALTKQAGLYIATVYPLLCYIMVLRRRPGMPTRDTLKFMAAICMTTAILIAPWYIYTEIRIVKGIESSELPYLTHTIHEGRSLKERVVNAVNVTLLERVYEYNYQVGLSPDTIMSLGVLVLVALMLSMFHESWRYISVLITVPFSLIWLLYFSYDLRNLLLVVPLIGGAAGFGVSVAADASNKYLHKINSRSLAVIATVAAGALLAVNMYFDKPALLDRQRSLQKEIGQPGINNVLYMYHATYGLKGEIITNYTLAGYLPELERFNRFDFMTDLSILKTNIDDPETRYILVVYPPPELPIMDYLTREINIGKLRVLMSNSSVFFLEIKKDSQ
jgi:hypothetical protein